MKRKHWIILIVALLLGTYLISHYVAVPDDKLSSRGISVSTAVAVQKNVTVSAEAIGQVLPLATVSVSSQVDGQLAMVNFKEGQLVNSGETLFQIDPRPFQAKLAQAEGTLANDKAQLWNAKLVLQRYTPLEKKGYVSKQDYDQAQANVEALSATMQADEAAVEQAQLQLSYCTIAAPITGRTGNLLVNAGNIVTANTTALVTINQMQPIYVSFTLPDKQLSVVRQNWQQHDINVIATTNAQQKIQGKLSFINNSVDNTTATIQLKATFANQNNELWPGQYVKVHIPVSQINQAIVVPEGAIQQGQQGAYIYVVINNKTVKYQPVTVGPQTKDGIVIEKGLAAGDKVVTAGQLRLTDGSKIIVSNS